MVVNARVEIRAYLPGEREYLAGLNAEPLNNRINILGGGIQILIFTNLLWEIQAPLRECFTLIHRLATFYQKSNSARDQVMQMQNTHDFFLSIQDRKHGDRLLPFFHKLQGTDRLFVLINPTGFGIHYFFNTQRK